MSIVGQTTSGGGAPWSDLFVLLILALIGAISVATAAWAGVFRRGSIKGPPRVGEREPLGMLLVVMAGAFLIWIMMQVVLLMPGVTSSGSASNVPISATTQSVTSSTSELTAAQMALLSSVPPLIAFAFMVIANRTIRRDGLKELGLSTGNLWAGISYGLVGSLIVVPMVFLAAQLTEVVWQAIHYTHPSEHELLKVMAESPSGFVFAVLISAAVLIAPLFEEMLFRGHLQTLLTYAWGRLPRPAPPAFEVVQPGPLPEYIPVTPPAPRPEPAAWMRWVSILLTSLLFSLVHPAWSIPPIFLLSVALGYAYERTGNLWTTITMHATFNAVSTMLFIWVTLTQRV
jgi:membrane protease YdiL (CAAX protease family)